MGQVQHIPQQRFIWKPRIEYILPISSQGSLIKFAGKMYLEKNHILYKLYVIVFIY